MAPRNLEKLQKKGDYLQKLQDLFEDYPKVLIISADFVGSRQFQEVRIALRGKAQILMGKNTMIRTALKLYQNKRPDLNLQPLIDAIRGNIGFVFCKDDMDSVRETVLGNVVPAAAKAGVIAPLDVIIPSGPTSLDPSQTSFFQALNIATKIVKGTIEITSQVHLIKCGAKVQMSEQVLLQKLNIRPFSYGLKLTHIYEDGNLFDSAVLEIKEEDIIAKFLAGAANVAGFSREVGVVNDVSVIYSVASAFKNMAALCSDLDYTFPEIQGVKDFLKDPSKFAAPVSSGNAPAAEAAPAASAEVEEEEEDDMGFDLFD